MRKLHVASGEDCAELLTSEVGRIALTEGRLGAYARLHAIGTSSQAATANVVIVGANDNAVVLFIGE